MFEKMTVAPLKAGMREALSSRSALTISMPLALNAWDAALEGLRVMPRMRQPGRARKVFATEEP